MLYQTEVQASAFDRLLAEVNRPGYDAADAARRMLKIDPTFAPAYCTLAMHQHESGNADEAEELLWKALEQWPGSYHVYSVLAAVRIERNKEDAVAADLHYLGVWKLSMMEEIPESIAEQFRPMAEKLGDPADPKTYHTIGTLLEIARNKQHETREFDERLRPYVLLSELQRSAPSVVAHETMTGIIEHADVCRPVLRAALRQWARGTDGLTDKAACMIAALLGEIGGTGVLEELLEIADDSRLFLHVHWAIHRIAEREPEAALAVFRATTSKAGVGLRCGLAEQMYLMDATPGIEDAIAGLVDHFSHLSRKQDAAHLVLAVHAALVQSGAESRAQSILARCSAMLPKKERAYVQAELESEEGFVPTLALEAIEGFNIDDVCLERVLMDDEKDEEGEEGEDDDEEDLEDEEDEEGTQVSASKLKAPNVIPDVAEYALSHLGEADQDRAKRLFFGASGKVESDESEVSSFLEWLILDYRPAASRQSVIQQYRRARESGLTPRERLYLESLRGARFGLWEAQDVDMGRGVRVKNLYTGEELFVHDVSSSRVLVRWDCMLTRVEEFEGKHLFVGTGVTVPRNLLAQFRQWIADESRAARQTEEEFVRTNSHQLHRVVREFHQEQRENLKIVNREGDPIEFSQATYQVLDEAALLGKLRALVDLVEEPDEAEPDAVHFAWLEPGDSDSGRTSLGHIAIRRNRLKLECNARKRLARGRRMLERQAKGCVRHLGDSFESVESALKRQKGKPEAEPRKSIPPEVERELLNQWKSKHYAGWPDEKLPALGGQTPREAVATEAGRAAVLDLIRMFENGEARMAREGGSAFDFTPTRRELGLQDD